MQFSILPVLLFLIGTSESQLPPNLPMCMFQCLNRFDLTLFSKVKEEFQRAVMTNNNNNWHQFIPYVQAVCEGAPAVLECLHGCKESDVWIRVLELSKRSLTSLCIDHIDHLKSIGMCVMKNGKLIADKCIKSKCSKYGNRLDQGVFSRFSSHAAHQALDEETDKEFTTLCRFLGCLGDCGVPGEVCGVEAGEMVRSFWRGVSELIGASYSAMRSTFREDRVEFDCLGYAMKYGMETGEDEKDTEHDEL